MKINREHILQTFHEYTRRYDPKLAKIRMKIEHTLRTAGIIEEIAESLRLSGDDIDLAWAIGMLHDIGRFEQIRRYDTFVDAVSVNHADFGADLLFREHLIEAFFPGWDVSGEELKLLELAIRQHNRYRMSEGLNEKESCFCSMIRDADKIDILRVNAESSLETIFDLSKEEIRRSRITPAVYEAFCEEHCILHGIRKTPADLMVSHVSLAFELVYPASVRIAEKQGYLLKLFDFDSEEEDTIRTFEEMKERMTAYLKRRSGEVTENCCD